MISRVSDSWAYATSLLSRIVFAALIAGALVLGDYRSAVFYSAVFIALGYVWLLPDERALWGEALLVVLFSATLALGLLWHFTLPPSVLGPDKLFHFLAGGSLALLAWFGAPFVPARWSAPVRRDWRFALLAFALAAAVFVGWEVFEWLTMPAFGQNVALSLVDTWTDIAADTLGALAALAVVAVP